MTTDLRIISGKFKKTKIEVVPGITPTLGRVRKSIFDILYSYYNIFRNVLDGFAGSGALGLEAISIGCDTATFVEIEKTRIITLINNIRRIAKVEHNYIYKMPLTLQNNENQYHIIHKNLFDTNNSDHIYQYDLVLLDPPFNLSINYICDFMHNNNILNKNGCCIVIHRKCGTNDTFFQPSEYFNVLLVRDIGPATVHLIHYQTT